MEYGPNDKKGNVHHNEIKHDSRFLHSSLAAEHTPPLSAKHNVTCETYSPHHGTAVNITCHKDNYRETRTNA
jgi:hypothetical protein